MLDRIGSGVFHWTGIFLIGGLLTLPVAPLIPWFIPPRASVDRQVSPPAGPGQLFAKGRGTSTIFLWIAICLTMMVLSAMNTWLPTLMIHKGQSHANGALAAFLFGAVGVAGGFLLGRPMDRFGFVRPLVAVFATVVASASALALVSASALLLASAAAAGFSCCAGQLGLYALFPRYYPASARSTGAGAGVAAGRVGSVLGPLLCGTLLGRGAGPGQVVAALIPAAVGAGLVVIALSLFGRPFEEPHHPAL